MTTIEFAGCNCHLRFDQYQKGNAIAIRLESDDCMPIATATVNIPEFPLQEGQCLIKDYAENEGILQALVEAGVVQPVGTVPAGRARATLCKLLVPTEE